VPIKNELVVQLMLAAIRTITAAGICEGILESSSKKRSFRRAAETNTPAACGPRNAQIRNLFEQGPQILDQGVFFVSKRAIGDKELLAQVQCLYLHSRGFKPVAYPTQELIFVPLIFSRVPCVINRSHIELIERYFGSQLNFATGSAINLSSASMTELLAYMQ
jgi:hypothetical protein